MSTQGHTRVAMLLFIVTLFLAQAAHATVIEYTVANLDANRYQYTYTITNDGTVDVIDELAIIFTYGLYDNLAVEASSTSWDTLAVNPDLLFDTGDDGYVDTLALVAGLAPGQSLSGLTVSFDWLGEGGPGSQAYAVLDPADWSAIELGQTTPAANAAPVPEPASMLLLGSGLLGLAGLRRKAGK